VNVQIEIDRSLKEQFTDSFGLDEEFNLDPAIGAGAPMKHLSFPGEMELYHFQTTEFLVPISMKSLNPSNSAWFLVHINLGASRQRKIVAGQTFDFHRSLPIGLLIYGPGLEIDTHIPENVAMELVSIRFNAAFLRTYFEDWPATLAKGKPLISEDLDYLAENKLRKALQCMDDKLRCHSTVLAFLDHLFNKLQKHDGATKHEHLRQNEIDGLFRACAALRVPPTKDVPSLDELAALANMGRTKFSSLFKQIFGSAPMQYRNKVRMEFAREKIASGEQSPTEVSYLLGYSHPSNFTAAYKRHFGDVPSSERQ
jgi:AraC-like DNA-binding protein